MKQTTSSKSIVNVHKRTYTGKVVKISGNKTIKVKNQHHQLHPKYHKPVLKQKLILVHDEEGKAKLNDIVKVIECRPISRHKSFRLLKIKSHHLNNKGQDSDSKSINS